MWNRYNIYEPIGNIVNIIFLMKKLYLSKFLSI